MYKVIIIDDEEFILEELKEFIDWESLGFSVAGVASNGNDAYELIERLQPQAVLMDIEMPLFTGIDLMKRIKENGIKTKVVVLSGYDEFEYAKSALEAGAVDYLLKPVEFGRLKEVFKRIKVDCDNEIRESILFGKAFKLAKEQFITRLANGEFKSSENVLSQAQELNLRFECSHYLAIAMEIDDYKRINDDETDTLIFIIKRIIDEICSKYGGESYSWSYSGNRVDVIIGTNTENNESLKPLINFIKECIDRNLDITTTLGIGYICNELTLISSTLNSARNALRLKFVLGKDRIIWSDINSKPDIGDNYEQNVDSKLFLLLQGNDQEGIFELIDKVFVEKNNRNEIYYIVHSIIRTLQSYFKKNNLRLEIDGKDKVFDDQWWIDNKETLPDIIMELKEVFAKALDYLAALNHKSRSTTVERVKNYIDQHYADAISLEVIASDLGMNSMYLSKIFKKEMGINFIDYITLARIEKAKELLKDSNLKIYEISERVGYFSPKHFSQVFKSVTGLKPNEFKQSIPYRSL